MKMILEKNDEHGFWEPRQSSILFQVQVVVKKRFYEWLI